MKKLLVFIFLFSINFFCKAQSKILPGELQPFVLNGYTMLDYIEGDLNADKRKDALLILKANGEDTMMEQDLSRPFLLLIRQDDGKLKIEKRNDNLVMCYRCGGVFGDPYDNMEIKNNGFSISFYGGSSWRWSYDYNFSYDVAKNNWFLVKEQHSSYHNTEPEINIKEATIEADEFGIIPIEKFNSDLEYSNTEWKVVVAKAYFYDNPKLGSKSRKGYLLKGDTVTASRVLKNFVHVSFENKKEIFTSGYILKTALQQVK